MQIFYYQQSLLTTQTVNVIKMIEFFKAVFNQNLKVFVIHMITLNCNLILVTFNIKSQIALLIVKKINILDQYIDFFKIFLK